MKTRMIQIKCKLTNYTELRTKSKSPVRRNYAIPEMESISLTGAYCLHNLAVRTHLPTANLIRNG